MKQIHIKMTDEIHAKIIAKAAEAKRSLNQHIIHIIERDLNTFEIPIEGVVNKDGKVIWNEREQKWSAPIKIKVELDRR